jgi:hypothetical protein
MSVFVKNYLATLAARKQIWDEILATITLGESVREVGLERNAWKIFY